MFDNLRRHSSSPTSLLDIISEVRTRWRMKLALRGAVAVAAYRLRVVPPRRLRHGVGAVQRCLDHRRARGDARRPGRVGLLVPVRSAAPPRHRRAGGDVSRRARAVATGHAVERRRVESERPRPESTALVRRVVEQAIDACQRMDASKRVERQPLRRYAAALGAVGLIALLALAIGPAFLRDAMSAMLLVSSDVEAASPYRIEVKPGNVTVPKGADQTISAKLLGFDSEDVTMRVQRAGRTI